MTAWKSAAGCGLLVLCGLHAGRIAGCFDAPADACNDRPIVAVDHALHLYHGSLGSRFLREGGANWGYDPFFMAGYPKTPFHDPSAFLSDISQFAAGSGYRPAAYKLGLLFTIFTGPLLLYAGGRNCGLSGPAALAAVGLATVYYWLDYPKALLDSGLYAFLWSCCWLPMAIGMAVRWGEEPTARRWLLMTGAASLAFLIHPTMSVMAAPPLLVWFILRRNRPTTMAGTEPMGKWKWRLATALAGAVAVAVNTFWIVPMLRFRHYRGPQFHFMTAPADQPLFFLEFYLPRAYAGLMAWLGRINPKAAELAPPNHWWLTALTVAGFLGIAVWLIRRRWSEASSIGAACSWLFALAFFGSMFEAARPLEPVRYQVPFHMLMSIPAADLAIGLLGAVIRNPRWTARIAAAVTVAGFAATVYPFELRPPAASSIVERTFPCGLPAEADRLVEWINRRTDHSARILFEDQLRLREATVPESIHWTPLLPVLTGRQFIGGQYQCAPLVHQHAAFGDFELGRRPIDQYRGDELRAFINLYNVGWAICWSPKSRAVFDLEEGLEKLGELPRHATRGKKPSEERYFLYRVRRPGSFFVKGNGRVVSVAPNRIELADVEPDASGEAVIRYHWFECLHAGPEVKLFRAETPGDPVGFIGMRLRGRQPSIVIANHYR